MINLYDFLVLCEKPSAKAHFAKVMGGNEGTFNGKSYILANSIGHLLKFKDPDKQVGTNENLQKKYANWQNLNYFPWDLSEFQWLREPIPPAKSGKFSTTPKMLLDNIKKMSKLANAIVIATDNDPTGEGDLLAWEIINEINWKGTVYRIKFTDGFNKAELMTAFDSMIDVSDQSTHGAYLKGEARSRFDFASMQLTRIATFLTRKMGYNIKVVRVGRLKSVIVKLVYDQAMAYANYTKKPYYEIRFKDENDHVYINKSDSVVKNEDKTKLNLSKFSDSPVNEPTIKRSYRQPPKLINLSTLGSILAKKGYSSKEVKATYQNLYQAGIVSYPRTADVGITQSQFDELLPLSLKIAKLVGVDTSLLTHKVLRKRHLDDNAEHGANRPSRNVPDSLDSLKSYGKSAVDIYVTIAKSYLAILCEDYVYDVVSANLTKYPSYVTSFEKPVALNWKEILDSTDEDSENTENGGSNGSNDNKDITTKGCGKLAKPFIYEGCNKRPPRPTQTSVFKYLEKYNVGTGATRLDAMATLTAPHCELVDNKGYLRLSDIGEINAIMLKDTYIADPSITEKLYLAMERVSKLEVTIDQMLKTLTSIVVHDKQKMINNCKHLSEASMEKPVTTQVKQSFTTKSKMTGVFEGQEVTFNTSFGNHVFSDEEIKDLLDGKQIVISFNTKTGKLCKVKGHFGKGVFTKSGKKYEYWGFLKDEFVND